LYLIGNGNGQGFLSAFAPAEYLPDEVHQCSDHVPDGKQCIDEEENKGVFHITPGKQNETT